MARDRDYRRRGRPGTSNRAALRCLASTSPCPGPSAKARRFRRCLLRFVNHSSAWCRPMGHRLKPPPDTTPDHAGDPSRVVFCLDGPSEHGFVNGYGRAFALARVARQGRPPKSNVDTTRGLDAGFSKTRVFFVRLRLPRRRSPAGARRPSCSLATRPGLAVNIVKLPELPGLRSRPAPLSACVLNRQFEIRR